MCCWSLVGGILAWRIKHTLYLVAITGANGVLYGISYSIFIQSGWILLVAPLSGLVITSASIVTYKQTVLQADNQKLQRLISQDSLTGINNRRRFDEYLALEWLRMAQEQQPLSLILCDVDYFKLYNDTYGHQQGDSW